MNSASDRDTLPNQVPPDSKSTRSEAQIIAQVEAERSGHTPVGTWAAFGASCLACLGVLVLLLSRAHLASPRLPSASVDAPAVVATPNQAPPQEQAPSQEQVPPINWASSFEDGQSRARASGKKMLVVFSAGWCSSCRWMESNVYPRPEVASEAQNVEMVAVDADARRDLGQRYSVRELPSYVWMSAEGGEWTRHEGSLSAAQFAELMKRNR